MMVKENIDLKNHSNYKIGGKARLFLIPKNAAEVKEAVAIAHKDKLPIFILGGGTNLLISDEGFAGAVIKPEIKTLEVEGNNIKVGAGVLMADLLNFAIEKGLSGLEWAGGLPGTVGGAIRGNAGAFAGEIKDVVKEVSSLDISDKEPKPVERGNSECKFGYRNSIFKINNGKEIILEAIIEMKKGDKKAIRQAVEEKIKYRKDRHPMEYPNIGSIFKNVDVKTVPEKIRPQIQHVIKNDPFPVVPTAYLISECGVKGVSWGGAMISPKHPNFIVNILDAKAEDVKTLIKLVKAAVKEKFEIELEEEVIYVNGHKN